MTMPTFDCIAGRELDLEQLEGVSAGSIIETLSEIVSAVKALGDYYSTGRHAEGVKEIKAILAAKNA